MGLYQPLDADQDDLLEVLAEIIVRLMIGNDQLDARESTQREARLSLADHPKHKAEHQ